MFRHGYYIELKTDVMRYNTKPLINPRLFERYSEVGEQILCFVDLHPCIIL
jgi:hypothetical protein